MTTTLDNHTEEAANCYQLQRQATQAVLMLIDLASREGLPLPVWFVESRQNTVHDALTGQFKPGQVDAVEVWGNALGIPVDVTPRFSGTGFIHRVRLTMLGRWIEIWAFSE